MPGNASNSRLMQKAPVGAKAAAGFLQRIGGWFAGRNAARSAQELKEKVTLSTDNWGCLERDSKKMWYIKSIGCNRFI
jgi:hypothetical protein